MNINTQSLTETPTHVSSFFGGYQLVKPRCAACDEVGMEEEYWWNPLTKSLVHSSCAVRATHNFPWHRIEDPEKNKRVFVERLLMNNAVLWSHVQEKRYTELEQFFTKKKALFEEKKISREIFDEVVKKLVENKH